MQVKQLKIKAREEEGLAKLWWNSDPIEQEF